MPNTFVNTKITDNERSVLRSLAYNNFTAGEDYNGLTWANCINDSQYPSGLSGKTLSGVVSSLAKKGFIYTEGASRDSVIGWHSEDAYNFARELS